MTEPGRARAFWTLAPGRGDIRSEALVEPDGQQARIRALCSGISRGTETLVFLGQVPPSQYEAMRCPLQVGDFPGPLKYGYCSVGVVEAGPAEWIGRRVFCLHPHQDVYLAPIGLLNAVPDPVSNARAALAANMETAVNGLWDAGPRVGDRIAVVGAGVVGCLVAALAARLPGCEVELIDIDPRRAALAAQLGCRFALPDAATEGADLVVHASGNPAGLATALRLAGFESTVLEMSWYGERSVALPLGESFHSKRLVIKSSQVGSVATPQRARWSHQRRMALALSLLADPVFDSLISGSSVFDALPETLARLAHDPSGALCHLITY